MAGRLSEHPVLIPTSQGPAGGIVCEPAELRVAVMLLQGGGRSGRSGFSSQWAILSRQLAALGAVVLRYDFWKEGDSSMITAERYTIGTDLPSNVARDLALMHDVAGWFQGRTADLDLVVVGACYGARLGLELAGELPAVKASFLLVPYLRRVNEGDRARWRDRMEAVRRGEGSGEVDGSTSDGLDRLDPVAIASFESTLRNGPSWVWIGERDADEVLALERHLGERGLEVEVEPGAALYPGNDPDVQEMVRDRIVTRVRRFLDPVAVR